MQPDSLSYFSLSFWWNKLREKLILFFKIINPLVTCAHKRARMAKISILKLEGIIKKKSYERRDYYFISCNEHKKPNHHKQEVNNYIVQELPKMTLSVSFWGRYPMVGWSQRRSGVRSLSPISSKDKVMSEKKLCGYPVHEENIQDMDWHSFLTHHCLTANSYHIIKISFLKKRRDNGANFLWAPSLWVGRRWEPT